ncbi:chromatin target of PRMT1 protein isoform X2 [Halyomorpha halys]|nr:chromatin target of PRMT1 protein-like isoform X2 [Halyomorpha halys]
MTLEKSVLTNYTSMSLDERFTQLRRADSRLLVRGISDLRQQFASTKSRRLALQMSRRPSVIAALNSGRAFSSTSLGRRGGQIGRGGVRNFGRGRRSSSVVRGGNRPLRRSGSIGRLARSQSLTSLNSRAASPFRTRGRGRGGRNLGGRGNRGGGISSFRRGGINQRVGINQRGGRGRGGFVSRRGRGGNNGGAGGFGTNRGRGRGEGRRGFGGRGRGRGGQRPPPPSKEKLDMELDEYMASSRATLDKEIDTYMSQTQEKWE